MLIKEAFLFPMTKGNVRRDIYVWFLFMDDQVRLELMKEIT